MNLSITSDDRADRSYRNRCADRILEIVLEMQTWMGVGRLFIP